MVLIDMNGIPHELNPDFVVKVLIVGWISFILGILANCIYYIIHPMATQISPMDKLQTYIYGSLIPSSLEDVEENSSVGIENHSTKNDSIVKIDEEIETLNQTDNDNINGEDLELLWRSEETLIL